MNSPTSSESESMAGGKYWILNLAGAFWDISAVPVAGACQILPPGTEGLHCLSSSDFIFYVREAL